MTRAGASHLARVETRPEKRANPAATLFLELERMAKTHAEKMAKGRAKALRRLVKNTVINTVGTLEVHDTAFEVVSVTIEYMTRGGTSQITRADWKRGTPEVPPRVMYSHDSP